MVKAAKSAATTFLFLFLVPLFLFLTYKGYQKERKAAWECLKSSYLTVAKNSPLAPRMRKTLIKLLPPQQVLRREKERPEGRFKDFILFEMDLLKIRLPYFFTYVLGWALISLSISLAMGWRRRYLYRHTFNPLTRLTGLMATNFFFLLAFLYPFVYFFPDKFATTMAVCGGFSYYYYYGYGPGFAWHRTMDR